MDTRQVNQIVSQVAENIAAMSPGAVIPHLVLGEMLEVDRLKEPQRYYNLISKIKTELMRQHGIFLRTEHKVGYAICLPGDEIDLCEGKCKKGIKTIVRAGIETSQIRLNKIQDEAKRQKTLNGANKIGNIIGLLKMGGTANKSIVGEVNHIENQ